jgi:hypothetical protein
MIAKAHGLLHSRYAQHYADKPKKMSSGLRQFGYFCTLEIYKAPIEPLRYVKNCLQ